MQQREVEEELLMVESTVMEDRSQFCGLFLSKRLQMLGAVVEFWSLHFELPSGMSASSLPPDGQSC